jgi:lipopolysaccharide/colanic/teichoic acid biosynthesis glycosyltransferase
MANARHGDRLTLPNSEAGGRYKRPFDLLVVGLTLVVGSPLWVPLFAFLALLVYFDSGRPILFRTRRVGHNGRTFDMYKFRTMSQDAERLGPPMTRPNDPRVTRVGRFLRKTGLDELPQLWSVCKGDMSLVGPRPYNIRSHDHYVAWNRRFADRLQVRPGLAGPAALWGSTSDPANRLAWDLAYIRNQSLCWDVILLVRCVLVAFVAGWERKQVLGDESAGYRAGAPELPDTGR